MDNHTRVAYNALLKQIATLNGVTDVSKKFNVAPAVEQKMEAKIQASSEFLKLINIAPVKGQEGEKLGLGMTQTIASTTDTTTKDRETVDPTGIDGTRYRCEQTNSDTHLRYAKLDAWALLPNFQTLFRDSILQRIALDRILIGFNGTSRAATSDRAANPLLQDVNIGWLQSYRANAAQRVMSSGKTAGKIKVGKGADCDYLSLDALVFDLVSSMIDPWHQGRTDLVCVVGRELLHDKYFPLVNQDQPNTEKLAADLIVSQKRIGNVPAVQVPGFPANGLIVTPLSNLSIYWQQGSRRRSIEENSKRDRVETYDSTNEAYVVEDFGAGAVAEKIEVV
jgi:P2 family phage major capsid protein